MVVDWSEWAKGTAKISGKKCQIFFFQPSAGFEGSVSGSNLGFKVAQVHDLWSVVWGFCSSCFVLPLYPDFQFIYYLNSGVTHPLFSCLRPRYANKVGLITYFLGHLPSGGVPPTPQSKHENHKKFSTLLCAVKQWWGVPCPTIRFIVCRGCPTRFVVLWLIW